MTPLKDEVIKWTGELDLNIIDTYKYWRVHGIGWAFMIEHAFGALELSTIWYNNEGNGHCVPALV